MTQDEAKVFWAGLNPAQSLALLKAAPKVAGAWEREPWLLRRYDARTRAIAAEIDCGLRVGGAPTHDAYDKATSCLWHAGGMEYRRARSLAAAKAAADAALVAAGWLLVDEGEEGKVT